MGTEILEGIIYRMDVSNTCTVTQSLKTVEFHHFDKHSLVTTANMKLNVDIMSLQYLKPGILYTLN